MGYIVRMPKLGLEMEEGTLLEWTVDVDDEVSSGDIIAEIESEKSIGEVESREDGVLRRTYLDVGDVVPPGTPIGIVAAADADISDFEAEAESELEGTADVDAETEAATAANDGSASVSDADPETTEDSGQTGEDVKASPRARKRAEELGVDLTTVEGTGPQGSITADDVAEAAESDDESDLKASPRARKRAEELGVDLTTVEGTGPQGSITADDVAEAAEADTPDAAEADTPDAAEAEAADSMSGPTRTAPSLAERYHRETAVLDADVADALFDATTAARNAVDEDAAVTDVVLLAVTEALAASPRCNGTFADATHQIHDRSHVAVLTEAAAQVIVTDADTRSLSDVIEARQSGGDAGELTPTFTLSDASLADDGGAGRVVNPPAVAALEFDPVGQRATPTDDGVRLDRLVTLSLTYDTRALDATDARRFLDAVAEAAARAPALVTESYLD
ncbi:MAG: E3 binding domain-containing protein [Haloplanus sp.]